MKIKPKQTIIIEFEKEIFPCRSGEAVVQKIVNKTCFMVSLRGHSVILDIKDHGKTYTVKEVR